jgi:hypothetical protein
LGGRRFGLQLDRPGSSPSALNPDFTMATIARDLVDEG